MKKITVLGAGMVGRAIIYDLKDEYDVLVSDISEENLEFVSKNYRVKTQKRDLSKATELKEVTLDADLVVGALPGYMGFETVKSIIKLKKNIVDISFFPEDPFRLDALAEENGVTAIVDCGVAPGMSNIIIGYHSQIMKVDEVDCIVGGLPRERNYPWQYKAPFSPIDVIEEYTRPARIVAGGKIIIEPPLSGIELIDIDKIGTLEAFNSDGLRTLLKTMKISYMVEKTLRYPGHLQYVRALEKSGFFSKEPITIKGIKISPLEFTSKILFPNWKLEEGEDEFTYMRIILRGKQEGKTKLYMYTLLDRYDKETGLSSMARTTGFTASAAARLVVEGDYTDKGIIPPEYLGTKPDRFLKMISFLKERKVIYDRKETVLE